MDAFLNCLEKLAPALSTATGGLIAWFVMINQQQASSKREAKNLAGAFYGEITAIIHISKFRGYKEHFKKWLEHVQTHGIYKPKGFTIRHDYFKVYTANVGKLGLLKAPLPEKIAIFYTQAMSITEDIKSMTEGKGEDWSRESLISLLTNLITLFESCEQGGSEIFKIIEETYDLKGDKV
jgi:hypothetical protein